MYLFGNFLLLIDPKRRKAQSKNREESRNVISLWKSSNVLRVCLAAKKKVSPCYLRLLLRHLQRQYDDIFVSFVLVFSVSFVEQVKALSVSTRCIIIYFLTSGKKELSQSNKKKGEKKPRCILWVLWRSDSTHCAHVTFAVSVQSCWRESG